MRRTPELFFPLVVVASLAACGGCDSSEAPRDDVGFGVAATNSDSGSPPADTTGASDAGASGDLTGRDDLGAAARDGGADAGGPADIGAADAASGSDVRDDVASDATASATCGNSVVEGPEACDDGNTTDGDYCAADCTALTGSCGDGVLQANETCDDAMVADCASTHDGGDGACVSAGTCSAGYVISVGQCVPTNTTGLSVPCQNGPGWTLFRYHYNNNSTSAQIDVWDATCSYSFAPNSACNVREIYPGFGDVSRTSEGYPIFTSSNYMRVRFNVNGLNFSAATLWIQARSYATSSSTFYEGESILYGVREGGPVDNDFVYDWYELDWTGFLYPNDDPNLTAIQLYGGRGSGRLAVRAVELCVQ